MALRNRGEIKMNPTLFFPEHVAMLREIRKDEERISDELILLIDVHHLYSV